jgi:tetratricopeptide (TPR) repeat protein/tRNA A-37 threonylcarbamoyl transferase component Bud32
VLEALAAGGLDGRSRGAITAHLESCPSCQAAFLPFALRVTARARADAEAEVTDPSARTLSEIGLADTQHSGEREVSPAALALTEGQPVERYVILERLGAGAMGEVYAAWDPALDRKVAVKLIHPEYLREGQGLGDQFRQRMLREAQALARLSHPNVVTVHDVGLTGAHVFIAMEFVAGQTLTAWLGAQPRTWRQILEVFLAAGEGLAAAHAVGITHRDFKPDNVIVGADGRVRVMDFGLAHAHHDAGPVRTPLESPIRRAITQPGTMLGTPAYMSPEALYGRPTDFRSDQFSFCAALFEALYGLRPYAGETPAAIAAEIEQGKLQAPPRNTQVPRRVHQLVARGLERDPQRRFQALSALLVQLGRRRSMLRRRVIFAATLLGLGLVTGAVLLVRHREQRRCAQLEQRLAGVWDARGKQAVREALLASGKPWAGAAWRDVEARLDAYAAEWLSLRRATCEAGNAEGDEALGQRLVCLSRGLADLEAVTRLLSRPEPELAERAVSTASALPPLEACATAAPLQRPRGPEREDALAQLAAVKTSLDAARYAEALADAERLLSTPAVQAGRATTAEARLLAATASARLGDGRAAELAVERAILEATAAMDDELAARAWTERVGIAAVSGSADAERWGRFAEAAVARAGAPRELQASLANNLGVLAHLQGRFDDAVTAHRRALGLRQSLFGERHPTIARTHANLGAALRAAGRLDEAEAAYRRALALEEAVLDPSHPAVAETLNNLANLLQQRGELAAARDLHSRAISLKSAAYGAESLPVAVSLTNLAAVLLDEGDVANAVSTLERSLALKERLAGREALTVAVTLTNLAQAQRRQRSWSQAAQLDRRALEIRRARQGPAHPDLTYNLLGLGEALLELGRLADAEAALEAALPLNAGNAALRAEAALALARVLLRSRAGEARALSLLEEVLAATPPESRQRAEARAMIAATSTGRRRAR